MFHNFAFGCGYVEDSYLSFILMKQVDGAEDIKTAITHFARVLVAYLEDYEGWYAPPESCCTMAKENKQTYCPDCGTRLSDLPPSNKPNLDEGNEDLGLFWRGVFARPNDKFSYELQCMLEANGWIFTHPGGTNWVMVEGLDNILNDGITDRSIHVYTRLADDN